MVRSSEASPIGRASVAHRAQLAITGALVAIPIVSLILAFVVWWDHGVGLRDVLLMVVFFFITGHGVTVGYHRLLTHRSFVAARGLRWALTLAGSMAFQGGVIGWVATHRRHHAFADRAGDPHSPHQQGTRPLFGFRGAVHAHVGWLFADDPTSATQYAPDLLAERFMRIADRLFPVLCVASLGLPLLAGYLLTFTVHGMLTALLWAGLVRICLFQHITWSVNSICHLTGRQPFTTRAGDHASNVRVLAIASMGESWHNYHHSDPTSARHGALPHQTDSSAALIRQFERLGWARDVRWPDPSRVEAHRRPSDRPVDARLTSVG